MLCNGRKWRAEQTLLLQKKDENEAKALEELRAQAKKDLQDWYTRQEELLNQAKVSNRLGFSHSRWEEGCHHWSVDGMRGGVTIGQ